MQRADLSRQPPPPPRRQRLSRQQLQRRLLETDAALQRANQMMKALRGLAFTDPLTGLANRRGLDERLAQELSRAARRPDRAFSLLVIDLDGFKAINDTLGHAAGDQVLIRFARFLVKQLRSHDVVARTGGDEFTVLLPDTAAADCDLAVARLRKRLDGFEAGASVGAASCCGPHSTIAELTTQADEAMYLEKRRRSPRRVA